MINHSSSMTSEKQLTTTNGNYSLNVAKFNSFFLQLTYSPSASTPTTRCQGLPGTSGAATAVSVIASSPVATRSLLMTIKAVVVTIIIIIIINRPKPAYGRQGLAGLWGQDTDQAGTLWGVVNISLCAFSAQLG